MGSCAIAILATAMGCASLPPCPAKGGPAWRELTSDHFVLRTDLSPREALETLRTLEDTRAAMLASMWAGAAGPPGKSTAVARATGHCPEAELWEEALQAYLPRSFAPNLKSIRAIPCPLPAGAPGKLREAR